MINVVAVFEDCCSLVVCLGSSSVIFISFLSYEMMMRCWTEKPENRPTFDEISQFIGQLLNGHTLPSAGSRYEDGYSYQRMITKDITEDYQINNQYHDYDNIISAQTVWDVYITPESSSN